MSEPGWDQSKFDELLGLTLVVSKRSVADAINTAAYYVARKAIWFTPKASPSSIAQLRTMRELKIKGGYNVFGKRTGAGGGSRMAPIVAAMINARLGQKLYPGLYGSQMKRAVNDLIKARGKSIAFIKSGWIHARDALKPLAVVKGGSLPPDDPDAYKSSGTKGHAVTARPDADLIFATIENATVAKHDKTNALQKYGSIGLQKAFDDEAQSMKKYLESHWTEQASDVVRKMASS